VKPLLQLLTRITCTLLFSAIQNSENVIIIVLKGLERTGTEKREIDDESWQTTWASPNKRKKDLQLPTVIKTRAF
jgi:hypothetical protein